MPISNYVPTSAIARPGVCTSTTRPASPFEGQVIYETDTDLIRVWTGALWEIVINTTKTYANEAARNAAIPTPYEGLEVYLTAPTAPAATGGSTFIPAGIKTVYDGSNWVCVTEVSARTDTSGTVDVNPWVALTGGGTAPTVTLTTGTKALVTLQSRVVCSVTSTQLFYLGVVVTGASTIGVNSYWSTGRPSSNTSDQYINGSFIVTGLTPGSNTFGIQYGRTNVGGAVTFADRQITAVGLL
jgi:hypothetical protein